MFPNNFFYNLPIQYFTPDTQNYQLYNNQNYNPFSGFSTNNLLNPINFPSNFPNYAPFYTPFSQ